MVLMPPTVQKPEWGDVERPEDLRHAAIGATQLQPFSFDFEAKRLDGDIGWIDERYQYPTSGVRANCFCPPKTADHHRLPPEFDFSFEHFCTSNQFSPWSCSL